MQPILHGAPGFILLALVVALGAYLRTVAVAAADTYDKIIAQEHTKPDLLWPRDATYTEERLRNLALVYSSLKIVTFFMFLLITLVAFRAAVYAFSALPKYRDYIPLEWFYRADFGIILFLSLSFAGMWAVHHVTAKREATHVKAMREMREINYRAKATKPS